MSFMASAKSEWQAFREAPPGERFEVFNLRQQALYPAWVRPLYLVLSVLLLAAGVVFAVIPGPAFVFFGLAGACVAAQSAWVAKRLDRAEVAVRTWWDAKRERS